MDKYTPVAFVTVVKPLYSAILGVELILLESGCELDVGGNSNKRMLKLKPWEALDLMRSGHVQPHNAEGEYMPTHDELSKDDE